jgi:pSer/pThr/pTyr-binding forkhead associated (FHA) protein
MSRRGQSFWCDARFEVENFEPGALAPKTKIITQPFGIIGKYTNCDIFIDDRLASLRHVYLHADHRGVLAVNLAARGGMRVDGELTHLTWLRPGDSLELAGRFLRLAWLEIQGRAITPPPCADNPFASFEGPGSLCSVTLEPASHRGVSWTVGSELIFLGRSDACGIRLNQADIASVHCAMYCDTNDAFIVPLPALTTHINGHSIQSATTLIDGDILTIGQTRFIVHLTPGQSAVTPKLAVIADDQPSSSKLPTGLENIHLPAITTLAGLPAQNAQPFPLELVPPESRDAVLGWMLGTLHASQSEIIKRQDELQTTIELVLKHLQTETDSKLGRQNDELEAIREELKDLQVKAQAAAETQSQHSTNSSHSHFQTSPHFEEPRRPSRDLPPAPPLDPARSLETAAWLLNRIDKVSNQQKSTLLSFLTRRTLRREDPLPENDETSMQSDDSEPNLDDGDQSP